MTAIIVSTMSGARGSGTCGRNDGGGLSLGMAAQRGEAAGEALEPRGAAGEAIRRRDIIEVVDAAVLLQDPDGELLRDAVELGGEDRVHRLAAVERDDGLLQDLALGE